MVSSHFFDIDNLIKIDNDVWIVSKDNPNVPIFKISKSEFNLIQSGIYKKQNNKLEFNGKTFWLPLELFNTLKIKAKINKVEFNNLAISLQEFFNKDIINSKEFEINISVISELKNKTDDIYIICSKQMKRNYEKLISKLEEKLKAEGLSIKNFYYISDNFYNMNKDTVNYKKMRLLLQHLVGYKTDGNKFIDTEIERYDQITFYDDEYDTLKIATNINLLLENLLTTTESGLKDVIKEDVKEFRPALIVNKINDNYYNKMETKKVIISVSTLIKSYESFRNSKN
jgi:hypothetical protein